MVRKSSASSDRKNGEFTPTSAPLIEALESRQFLSVTILESNGLTAGSGPVDITRGLDGNYYFTEQNASQIGKVDPDQGVVTEYPVRTGTGAPSGITTAPDGNIYFGHSDGLSVYSPRRHRVTSRYGLTAAVGDVIVGPDGEIWFTQPSLNRIGRFFTDSTKIQFINVNTANSMPNQMTTDKAGSIWFSEETGNKIGHVIFRRNRFKVVDFAIPTAASTPEGLVQGADGNIWFAESQTGKIGVVDAGSGFIIEHSLPNPGAGPFDMTLGEDGNVWFTENLIGNIANIATDGSVEEFGVPAGFNSGPRGIVLGPGHTLWFTEDAGNQVAELFY